MKNLCITIKSSYIALFASGNSINELSDQEFSYIKSKTFLITINYAPVNLKGHLNIWSDRRVSEFLGKFYEENPKEVLLCAQKHKVANPLSEKVDYWFNRREDNLKGNYTIVWVLQLLQKYFPKKQILLFGVDMYNLSGEEDKWYDRYTDFDRKKRGKSYNVQSKLEQCARQIQQYCQKDKVINCNLKSHLHYFEKKDWRTILPLHILHLCPTALAGAPAHLSKILNKYTNCRSRSILKSEFKSSNLRNLKWDFDIKEPHSSELTKEMDQADLLHYHRKVYPNSFNGKRSILQYHSPPHGYIPGKTDSAFNNRKLVIAQYHPRFYTDAFIVPNLIDIWDDAYLPGEKPTDRVKLFFSWASEIKGGWSDKGSNRTKETLNRIKSKYKDRVEIRIMNNRPYSECMLEKKLAHICIDECVTGSYHLQSLEGCSVGAVTFNNIDAKTISYLQKVTGQLSHPFEKTDLNGLFEKLCFYIDNPKILEEKGRQSRIWMETNWDPRKLIGLYLKAYYDVFLHNEIKSLQDPIRPLKISQSTSSMPKKIPQTTIQERKRKNSIIMNKKEDPKPAKTKKTIQPTPSAAGKPISELHKKLQEDKEVFIFGTGPSLFNVDPEDFKNKICFGINFSFEVMPYMDYIFVHVIEVYEAIKKVVDNEKLILPETLVRQWYREKSKLISPNRIPTANEEAYIYPIQDPRERNIQNKKISLGKNVPIFTWSTTMHSAIHIAAYMGAKKINLIGADYKMFPNGKVHFESKYYPAYGAQNWNANKKHRQGDEWLAGELKRFRVKLDNLSRQYSSKKIPSLVK